MQYLNPSFRPRRTIMDLPLDDTVMSRFAKMLTMEDILNLRLSSWALRILSDKIIRMREMLHIGCCEEPIPCLLALKCCQHLRVVHFSGTSSVTDVMLNFLTIMNSHIREFKVIDCPRITSDGLISLGRLKRLTHLEISDMVLHNRFFSIFAKNYIQLQEVTFKDVHGFLGKTLAMFFRKQTNLRSITLCSLLVVTRPILLAIGSSCRKLEQLAVLCCKGVDDQGVLCIATGCHQLDALLLSIYPVPQFPDYYPITKFYWANVSREVMEYLATRNIRTRIEPQ